MAERSPDKVCDILANLHDLGSDENTVTVGDVVESFGNRSYGPFLFVPALIGVSPIGGIPGVPTFLAVIIALFAIQMVLGRRSLWLPGVIKRRSVSGDRLCAATDKLQGVCEWMDRWFHGRLEDLTQPPVPRIVAAVVLVLCCLVPPLEVVPFAVAAPMAVIVAFGLALVVRDGALMLVTMAGAGGAGYLAYSVLGGGSGG